MEGILDNPSIWKTTPDAASNTWSALGFRWMEQGRQTDFRWVKPRPLAPGLPPQQPAGRVSLFGEATEEMLMRFRDKGLAGMMALFFTRGDSGDLPFQDFQTRSAALARKLDAWAGAKGIPQKEDARDGGGVIVRGIWTRGDIRVDLESGYTRTTGGAGRPEFIRMRILPFDPSQRAQLLGGQTAREAPQANRQHGAAVAMEMKRSIQSRPNGDRIIAVPMVDQGPKGYCVAAVMERVAQFYGRAFDQHEAAQIAGTEAESGTTSDKLVKSLRQMARLMKMTCSGRTDIDDQVTRTDQRRGMRITVPKEFEELLKQYNREAKKAGLTEYDIWAALDLGGIDVVYNKLNKNVLRSARLAEATRAKQFQTEVKRYLDAGVPVVWVVMTGIVKEADLPPPPVNLPPGVVLISRPEPVGGHLRMIVGYNAKTNEFIYSDTWGPGHEEKRISMDDAWVINRGFFVVTPQGTRF